MNAKLLGGGGVVVLLAASMIASGSATVLAAKPGDSGFLSLRQAVGARESAMGGAGVASAYGAAGVYWNPARLTFDEAELDLILQHQRMYGLFSKETAALAHHLPDAVLGVFFTGFFSDAIERFGDEPVGVSEGSFKPYDVAFGVAYARRVVPSTAVGAMVKMLHEKIDIYGDTGVAADLFICHQATIPGLFFGASLTNFGPQMKLDQVGFDLPLAFRAGVAYDPQQPWLARKVTLAGDIVKPNDGNEKGHFGAEYRLLPELALRAGTRFGYDNQGMTAGLGVRKGKVEIGYAFEESKVEGLGDMHKFALEFHH